MSWIGIHETYKINRHIAIQISLTDHPQTRSIPLSQSPDGGSAAATILTPVSLYLETPANLQPVSSLLTNFHWSQIDFVEKL